MSFVFRIALAAALVLVSCLAASAATSSAMAQTPVANGVEGSWTGPFGEADWTFEFTRRDSFWSGRYMPSKGNKWHDLQSLVVSGNSIAFSIKSEPVLSFDLELDSSGQGISGIISIGSGLTHPFSAVRRS